ncbi:MAG TPA: hypothetical protein VLH75_17230 [Longimicrobiales bacterium]|nr:hypothetical protein [Longimicrobiales bacterium]
MRHPLALPAAALGHLTAAVDSAGLAGAIDFCSTQALPLTAPDVATAPRAP